MSNIEILEKGVEYTVLHRTVDTPQPYIVAWKFHPQTMDWEQGHYFEDRESAFKWFTENDLCNCIHCDKQGCPHREAYRRLPQIGGLNDEADYRYYRSQRKHRQDCYVRQCELLQ